MRRATHLKGLDQIELTLMGKGALPGGSDTKIRASFSKDATLLQEASTRTEIKGQSGRIFELGGKFSLL